jgi:hypothetical protein
MEEFDELFARASKQADSLELKGEKKLSTLINALSVLKDRKIERLSKQLKLDKRNLKFKRKLNRKRKRQNKKNLNFRCK